MSWPFSPLSFFSIFLNTTGTPNVFVSMPTGAGKSLCYQLPALLFSGVTLVLSPLIALIEDQVTHLKALHIKAESLNSKTSSADRKRILSDLHQKSPSIKLLYVTPELVATSHFRNVLDNLYKFRKISLIAVDEAHCVSEWGHDFRPDYLKLGDLREAFSSVQWLAITATATPHVQKDIVQSLRMSARVSVFKAACFRENLFYEVTFKEILKDPLQVSYCSMHTHTIYTKFSLYYTSKFFIRLVLNISVSFSSFFPNLFLFCFVLFCLLFFFFFFFFFFFI